MEEEPGVAVEDKQLSYDSKLLYRAIDSIKR